MCYEASPEHATSWMGMTGLPHGRSSIWVRPQGMSSKHEIVKSKRRWPPERWNCPGKGTEAAETGWGWGNLALILSKLESIRDKARRVGWGCTEERVKFRCSGQWWTTEGLSLHFIQCLSGWVLTTELPRNSQQIVFLREGGPNIAVSSNF